MALLQRKSDYPYEDSSTNYIQDYLRNLITSEKLQSDLIDSSKLSIDGVLSGSNELGREDGTIITILPALSGIY